VLHRAQTPADRAFDPSAPMVRHQIDDHNNEFQYTPVTKLVRLARTLPNGSKIFLAVYAPGTGSPEAPLGDVLLTFATSHDGKTVSYLNQELAPVVSGAATGAPPSRVGSYIISVVPDNVSRVSWTFPRVVLPEVKGAPGSGGVLRGGTVLASVVGNVAAARMIPHSFSNPSIVKWLAADDRIIKTTHNAVPNFSNVSTTGGSVTITGTGTVISTGSVC
jgi:hypothetical protein